MSEYDSQDLGSNQNRGDLAEYGEEDEDSNREVQCCEPDKLIGASTHDFAWAAFWVFGAVTFSTIYYILDR